MKNLLDRIVSDPAALGAVVTAVIVLLGVLGAVVPVGLGAALIGVIGAVTALLKTPAAVRVADRAYVRSINRP